MNKSYTVVNNQVIVKDDISNETTMEYCDNIAEVLIEQNIIEEINNKIEELKKEQSYLDSLLQDKTITRAVVDNTTFQVDHSTQIRAINNYANAIYEMAKMSEKYYYNTETGPVLKHNLTQD